MPEEARAMMLTSWRRRMMIFCRLRIALLVVAVALLSPPMFFLSTRRDVRRWRRRRRRTLLASRRKPRPSAIPPMVAEPRPPPPRGERLRVLYCITAYDRKQHVHLLQMLLSVTSMCEGGLGVRVVVYTADSNPYTTAQNNEMRQILATCSREFGGWTDLRILEKPASLSLEMTMQHRREVLESLSDFDVFVYAEDDVHVELRHVMAYWKHARRLAAAPDGDRYLLGWQRFEKTGIGAGAEQVMWENGIDSWHAIEIGGELYVTMVNPHAGAWIATREELIALHKQCNILRIPKTANSFTRVRAGGWNMYLNCGRRKILPVADFPAFIVHHLPDKNWWQRSECAVVVPDLLDHLNTWLSRFRNGDHSMVCGKWWDGNFCRDEMKVVPSAERKRRFGVQGSCTVWRNKTTGEETVILPNERLKDAGAIMKAREAAARIELKRRRQSTANAEKHA